jgi:hypothetical protein
MRLKLRFPFIPGLAHRAGALLTGLVLTACGEQARPEPSDVLVQQRHQSESEVRYVRSADEFKNGVAELKATRYFRSFGLQITADPASVLEYQVLAADGSWSDWRPVKLDEDNGPYRGGHQVLSGPATEVRIRASVPAEFLRFELFSGTEAIHDDDEWRHEYGLGELGQEIARPGIWTPSPDTLRIGDSMYLPYESADYCYGSLRPGTKELGDFILAHFPGTTSYGGYICRDIVGDPGSLSVHSTGRALDVFVPVDGASTCSTCADNDKGDALAKWLIENAEYIGFSFVIWDQADWGAHRSSGSKWGSYGGAHPHNDHLHIELTAAGAARQTGWFLDGKPWNTGTDTFTGLWYLRDFLSAGPNNIPGISYGGAGDIPRVGDWDGNGYDTVGVYRNGVWYLRNANTSGPHTVPSFTFGNATDTPLVGDWNGDGIDTIGVWRGGNWYLRDFNSAGANNIPGFTYGGASDIPVVGDWDGDGKDTVGVYRNGVWYLRNSNSAGSHTVPSFTYGGPGDIPVVGDWNGDGIDTVGLVRNGVWYLRNSNTAGPHTITSFSYGTPGTDLFLVGDWNADGLDTVGVAR